MSSKLGTVGSSLGSLKGERQRTQFGKNGELCTICQETKLSRYNKTRVCAACTMAINNKMAMTTTSSIDSGKSHIYRGPRREAHRGKFC